MSLALDSGRMDRSGFANQMQGCMKVHVAGSDREGYPGMPPEGSRGGVRNKLADEFSSGSSSSSIGRNSSSGRRSCSSDGEEPEVQSSYKGPLESMDSLEDSLPIRRGISNFYTGRSKSFTSLSEAAAIDEAGDLAKPENPYNRKRKNLLLRGTIWERNQDLVNGLRKSRSGMFLKRPVNSCRSTLTVCVEGEEQIEKQQLPPLPPNGRPPCNGSHSSSSSDGSALEWSMTPRSFSLVDLQQLGSIAFRQEKHNNGFH